MSNLKELEKRRDIEFFRDWMQFVPAEKVAGARDSIRQLIDDLVALGEEPDEGKARAAVSQCVVRFNELDDGWIASIERDELCEAIWKWIDLSGFKGDEDWLEDREW